MIYLLFFRSGGIVMLLSATHLLVLSGSCSFRPYPFNRSVVPAFRIFPILPSFASLLRRSAAQIISFLILLYLVLTGVVSIYILPFNLKVFRNVLCPSFLTECFQICHLRYSFSRNGLTFSRFFGLTRLSKKQLSFTSSLSLLFSLRCHSRSRDEILS